MDYLALIQQYGLMLVFANVLVVQLGVPLPAYPTLVVTGALAVRGDCSVHTLLFTAVAAAMMADISWYIAGRRFGQKVTFTLCQISPSPANCIGRTGQIDPRWAALSLLIAKFIPGFASLASAFAGSVGTSIAAFLLFDTLGAAIWAGSAIFLGSIFGPATQTLLNVLRDFGKWGGLLLAVTLVAVVVTKWWRRQPGKAQVTPAPSHLLVRSDAGLQRMSGAGLTWGCWKRKTRGCLETGTN
jgi:membrane protein DedA with SNARE-associated domain